MTAERVMLGCGHSANAVDGAGNPTCAICIGINPGANVVVAAPSLEGREAKCLYCKTVVPSRMELAFFEHTPDEEYDAYYSGCLGWD